MRYFYFNPPVSVKVCESSKIIWIPRTSMRPTRLLTAANKQFGHWQSFFLQKKGLTHLTDKALSSYFYNFANCIIGFVIVSV